MPATSLSFSEKSVKADPLAIDDLSLKQPAFSIKTTVYDAYTPPHDSQLSAMPCLEEYSLASSTPLVLTADPRCSSQVVAVNQNFLWQIFRRTRWSTWPVRNKVVVSGWSRPEEAYRTTDDAAVAQRSNCVLLSGCSRCLWYMRSGALQCCGACGYGFVFWSPSSGGPRLARHTSTNIQRHKVDGQDSLPGTQQSAVVFYIQELKADSAGLSLS